MAAKAATSNASGPHCSTADAKVLVCSYAVGFRHKFINSLVGSHLLRFASQRHVGDLSLSNKLWDALIAQVKPYFKSLFLFPILDGSLLLGLSVACRAPSVQMLWDALIAQPKPCSNCLPVTIC